MLVCGLLILYLTAYVKGDCCEENWIRHGSSCYLFIGSKETWMEAMQMCAARKSTLAAVQTAEENNFIKGYLKVFAGLGADMTTWIGGTDMEIEGVWKWSPSGEKVTFEDWYPGEPASPVEDCIVMYGAYQFQWGDLSCHTQESFICEKPIYSEPIIG